MKIRSDFITNSSSVCYVIAFKEKIKSLEHLKNELFPGFDFASLEGGKIIPLDKVCRCVFRTSMLLDHKIINPVNLCFIDIAKQFYNLFIDDFDKEYEIAVDKAIIGVLNFIKEHESCYVYFIKILDNSISGSVLLGTNVFDKYPHLISHDG